MFDGQAFGAEIVGVVKGYLDQHISPLLSRVGALERRVSNIKDADPEDVAGIVHRQIAPELDGIRKALDAIPAPPELPDITTMVADTVKAAIDAIPAPQDGKDGRSVSVEDVAPLIAEEVSKAVAAIPAPKDGEPGKDGRDGVDGKDAEPISKEQIVEAVLSMPDAIKDAVAEFLTANPPPAGKDGRDGVDGKDGEPGERGADGRDGVDAVDAMLDKDGNLNFTFSDGRIKNVGMVCGRDGRDGSNGKDGEPGAPGRDGFGFDDLSVEYDGERTITFKFMRGDLVKEFPVVVPLVLDRGLWTEAREYKAGDGVTWGGHFWIAQRDTADKPDNLKDWRIAVKRGRDGKSAPSTDRTPPKVKV